MDAIVLNTLTGAVSEYDNFPFNSITPTHGASVNGLFELMGDSDNGQPVVATVQTGRTLLGTSHKKMVDLIHVAIKSSGTHAVTLVGDVCGPLTYPLPIRPAGVSRARPGRGIRENYIAVGYSNPDGEAFQLDRVEVAINESPNRKTQ